MDITIATYGQPILNEITCGHMEVTRIPQVLAQLVRDRMGAPYESTPVMSRWSGIILLPITHEHAGAPMPFELVICERGASIRCHWDHADLIHDVIGRMVPEIIATVMPILIAA